MKIWKQSLLVALVISLVFTQCKSKKQKAEQMLAIPKDFSFSLERTPCFGSCPVYKLTVNAAGKVDYFGSSFAQPTGKQEKQLTKDQVAELEKLLSSSAFFDFADKYDNQGISDLPSTIIGYAANGKTKQVVCRTNCPEKLITLIRSAETIIGKEGYKAVQE
jgi:hypothetical protein